MLAKGLELVDPTDVDAADLVESRLAALEPYVLDRSAAFQQKFDGMRMVIDCAGAKPVAFNRDGDRTDIPLWLRPEVEVLRALQAVIDGEVMPDNRFYPFDMIRATNTVTPGTPWHKRVSALQALIAKWQPARIRPVPTAITPSLKRNFARRIFEGGFEGLIIKRVDAPYEPGPRRTGAWQKVKHTRTVDCVVTELGVDKENLTLAVYSAGELVGIGSCSRLEGDAPRAAVNDVLEVEFLNSGSVDRPRLYQAHAKRLRTDKAPASCDLVQLDGTSARKEVAS